MIETSEAIRTARALIGTAYSELDCINLIKKVIRTAPGGDKNYTTAGTNDLWNSDSKSAKYRDLTWKQEGISGAKAVSYTHLDVYKRQPYHNSDHIGSKRHSD